MTSFHLYDYQADMARRVEAALRVHRAVMVQMPTGTGKTVVLGEVIMRLGGAVWIVAHRRELVAQIEATVDRMLAARGLDADGPERRRIRVCSIQWLARHVGEMAERPALIVIDEAHHAVAKTYRAVTDACPQARVLGLTATPCRMTRRGLSDLFEVLLCAEDVDWFVARGRLAEYDYVSLMPDSEDQRLIDGLQRRAADGDYSVAEMGAVLDTRPTIGRLYRTVAEYVPGRKGIVYAIDIAHAGHIADYYRAHGLRAVALSCKTPAAERDRLVGAFRDGDIDVLVNVDLFGEGFDCPDVEYIQLARPTLSLAKYLQMVGRGLRVAEGKRCCVLLDNVGLYRLFGLPDAHRDWQATFYGRTAGKGVADRARELYVRLSCSLRDRETDDSQTEVVMIARHGQLDVQAEEQRRIAAFVADAPRVTATRRGYMSYHYYLRLGEGGGVYAFVEGRRQGWRLMTRDGVYYTLHEASERMVRVGRRHPWSRYVSGMYYNTPPALGAPLDAPLGGEPVRATEYLIDDPDAAVRAGSYLKDCAVDRDERTPDALQRREGLFGRYATVEVKGHARAVRLADGGMALLSRDRRFVLIRRAESIRLEDHDIACVRLADGQRQWINLYTMQAFDERPQRVLVKGKDCLCAGGLCFARRERSLTGIPVEG